MNRPNDTSPEADRVLTEIFRRMTIGQKWLLLGSLYRTAKTLHEAGVRARKPDATAQEIHASWLAVTLGEELARAVREAAHEPTR
jgi:hypothetical protein